MNRTGNSLSPIIDFHIGLWQKTPVIIIGHIIDINRHYKLITQKVQRMKSDAHILFRKERWK